MNLLMQEFIDLGFKAIVVCVNATLPNQDFLGLKIDEKFMNDMPSGIDSCRENLKIHTFCFDASYFKNVIQFFVGEKVLKEYDHDGTKKGFWFCDLFPAINQLPF